MLSISFKFNFSSAQETPHRRKRKAANGKSWKTARTSTFSCSHHRRQLIVHRDHLVSYKFNFISKFTRRRWKGLNSISARRIKRMKKRWSCHSTQFLQFIGKINVEVTRRKAFDIDSTEVGHLRVETGYTRAWKSRISERSSLCSSFPTNIKFFLFFWGCFKFENKSLSLKGLKSKTISENLWKMSLMSWRAWWMSKRRDTHFEFVENSETIQKLYESAR